MVKNKKRARLKTMKGQALMEYFITYGVALLVILIVLGIIVALVLPMLNPPATCKFSDPNFSCDQKEHVLVADSNNNVRILFQLNNIGNRAVEVSGVLCTSKTPGNIQKTDITSLTTNKSIGSAGSITAGSASGTDIGLVECYKEDGTTKIQLTPNSNFKGTLAIKYNYQDEVTGAPVRTAMATVTGKVQAQ